MQQAIRHYPNSVDFGQCHLYVTDIDIANHLEKDVGVLTNKDVDGALGGLGLWLDKEVYNMSLRSENTTGYFVSESALIRVGVEIPSWDQPTPSNIRKRRRRVSSRPSVYKPA